MNPLSRLSSSARNAMALYRTRAGYAQLQLIAADVDRQVHMTQAAAAATVRVECVRKRITTWMIGTLVALSASSAQAKGGGGADFQTFTAFLTALVEFMAGPFGKGVVIVSIIVAFVTWVFAPKEGIFGPILRVVVAGIAILNAGLFIGQFGTGGNVNLV
jgi:type IV secretory pathway VirB2 component (pilin)